MRDDQENYRAQREPSDQEIDCAEDQMLAWFTDAIKNVGFPIILFAGPALLWFYW